MTTTTVLADPPVTPDNHARPRAGGSFGGVVRAELQRLMRRPVALGVSAGAALFAVVAGLSTFAAASDTSVVSRSGGVRTQDLLGAGGATEAFATGASFGGFLVFVTFIAVIGGEFSGGTFRVLLLRYPNRLGVIVGKLLGLLLVTTGAIAMAEVLSVLVSSALAPSYDISTSGWFSLDGLGAAVEDLATALAGFAGWAILGTVLAVAFRSVALALGVGFAWAGPFENIVVESWEPGYRYFPGQVYGSLIRGGTTELGFPRAAATAAIYTAVAAAVALYLTTRRDVTS